MTDDKTISSISKERFRKLGENIEDEAIKWTQRPDFDPSSLFAESDIESDIESSVLSPFKKVLCVRVLYKTALGLAVDAKAHKFITSEIVVDAIQFRWRYGRIAANRAELYHKMASRPPLLLDLKSLLLKGSFLHNFRDQTLELVTPLLKPSFRPSLSNPVKAIRYWIVRFIPRKLPLFKSVHYMYNSLWLCRFMLIASIFAAISYTGAAGFKWDIVVLILSIEMCLYFAPDSPLFKYEWPACSICVASFIARLVVSPVPGGTFRTRSRLDPICIRIRLTV
mmetsp:Transcript_40451/g.65636  ORF Transcript_40451/g.65636 Transcript_40451/m.65636 type:complete len:281 (-) Transcript_40451:253-1095(-)